jgi:hypothetical protein
LPASPRGLSQLATSFFACLRQGIPTHALSSLTIKLTHNTQADSWLYLILAPTPYTLSARRGAFVYAHQVFSCQRSSNSEVSPRNSVSRAHFEPTGVRGEGSGISINPSPLSPHPAFIRLVGLGRLELPTSPLSGVRSNHLSYRPASNTGSGAREPGSDPNARLSFYRCSRRIPDP